MLGWDAQTVWFATDESLVTVDVSSGRIRRRPHEAPTIAAGREQVVATDGPLVEVHRPSTPTSPAHLYLGHVGSPEAATFDSTGSRLATCAQGVLWLRDLSRQRAVMRIVDAVGAWSIWGEDGSFTEGLIQEHSVTDRDVR